MRIPNLESLTSGYDCVYLAPHFDDAAACCGGRILAERAGGERVLVVTAFAGMIPASDRSHSPALRGIVDTERRRAEDAAAMDRLGVDFLWLDHLDAVFRYRIPLSRFRPWVSKRGADAALGARLREDLRRIVRASGARRLYAPLGVGQHVDHQIASRAAWELWRSEPDRCELVFYEEAPYALMPGALRYRTRLAGITLTPPAAGAASLPEVVTGIAAVLADQPTVPVPRPLIVLAVSLGVLGLELLVALAGLRRKTGPTLRPEIVDVSARMDAKAAAYLAYESQIHVDPATIRRRLEEYARKLGAGGECERYWHPVVSPGYPPPR